MSRFVIQEHHQSSSGKSEIHFDFMLESGEVLKTWRIPYPPDQSPQTIEQIKDHRKIYLDYEGEISGNRGFVKIWDKGEYITRTWSSQLIEIQLFGEKITGDYRIQLIQSDKWIFEKSLEPK